MAVVVAGSVWLVLCTMTMYVTLGITRSVIGWQEPFEPHSYSCNMYVRMYAGLTIKTVNIHV